MGAGRNEELCNVHRVSVLQDEKILEIVQFECILLKLYT